MPVSNSTSFLFLLQLHVLSFSFSLLAFEQLRHCLAEWISSSWAKTVYIFFFLWIERVNGFLPCGVLQWNIFGDDIKRVVYGRDLLISTCFQLWGRMEYILHPAPVLWKKAFFPNPYSLLHLCWHTHLIQSKIGSKIDEDGNSKRCFNFYSWKQEI